MKLFYLPLMGIVACGSWNQKDFRKEIEKTKEQEVRVQVSEELREKFEIQPSEIVPTKKAQEIKKIKDDKKKPSSQLVLKNKTQQNPFVKKSRVINKVGTKKNISVQLPSDYPEDLKSLNERVKKVWTDFKPNFEINKKTYLDINYLGMTVGKIMLTSLGKKMINNREVWHFHARFKSAPFYSKIYELDDTVDTFVTTDEFISSRYSLIQRESKFDIDDLQLYDRDQLKSFWFYKQKKSDGKIKNKKKEIFIPYFSIDPFSILFFLQGLPLKDGDLFEIPVVNKGKILIVKTSVEGRESIQTKDGLRKVIKIHATTKFKGDHLKDGDMYLWFSDDETKSLIKIKAKIKIGSITADLVDG